MNDGLKNAELLPHPGPVEESLYEVRRKIYPRAVSGWFARWRVALVLATQLVFFGTPWLEWNSRQAVLFDLGARKFYLFGLVLWPQDFVYLTLLLVISALALFLFTAVAGRLWCGYACPQTVYTEVFLWIEREIEGGRQRRIKLDGSPLSTKKLGLKAAKHGVWIALSLWTGFTFVGYFTPIRELALEAATLGLGPWETFWILFYGFATYGNAGWMREQVCLYMCPYARFQSAMFDSDTMIITYDRARGEPRGGRARSTDPKAAGLGDCVDCGICVQACPTGIDIREGLQYECIGCAACIDGCDQVMEKMGYRPGLIRYSTENALHGGWTFRTMLRRAFRPRVLVYTAVLAAVTLGAAASLALRVPLKVDVIRDRGSLSREAAGGTIENVYRLHIMNTEETPHRYRISVSGIPTLALAGEDVIDVPAAAVRMVPVRLRIDADEGRPGSRRIEFEVEALEAGHIRARERSTFVVR
ncbi:MAG: cytochrome c oxidase accessory protein CcoG [Burkholderiales bacterium]